MCPYFLPKLVSIRERIQDAVEEVLGLQLSLLIEFTGLISWRPGSSIGWHTDSNRKYLTQRFAAAVLYLNENELDFQGGNFKFRQETCPSACLNNETNGYHSKKKETEEEESSDGKTTDDGEIKSIAPVPGLLIAYNTSEEHCVDPEITSGERFTLAMWFTTDSQHDEDLKILETLKELEVDEENIQAPLPAAMHALPDGVDLRLCRLACYGVCLLKKRGERWVPLTSLEDGEWNRKQQLQLGVLKNSGKGELVLVVKKKANRSDEGGIQMSVQQAVVAVQGSLLVEKSGEEAAAVACEKVCLRHLNAFPGRVSPRIQEKSSSCSWVDESDRMIVEEVQGSSSSAAENRLEILAQAIHTYIDVEEPEQLQIWEETKERWLKAGAVF